MICPLPKALNASSLAYSPLATMQELADSSTPRPDDHMVDETTISKATQLPISALSLLLLSASSPLSSALSSLSLITYSEKKWHNICAFFLLLSHPLLMRLHD
eukprot:13023872-Ditylum_brightwellii.AAC.1